jgi:hypothetical protein
MLVDSIKRNTQCVQNLTGIQDKLNGKITHANYTGMTADQATSGNTAESKHFLTLVKLVEVLLSFV